MSRKLLRIGSVVIGLTLVWLGVRGMLKRGAEQGAEPRPAQTAQSAEEVRSIRARQALRDDEVLRSGKGTEQERFEALVRVGQRQELVARERALQWKSDASPLVREGAANALGRFDDPLSLGALVTLLKDPVRRVRFQALQALGGRPGEGREAVLQDLFSVAGAGVDRDTEWKARLQEARYRLSASAAGRAEALKELLLLAGAQPIALDLAAALEPRSPEVARALRARATGSDDPALAGNAIRQLAVQGDPWLSEHYQKLWSRDLPGIRVALLQALPMVCPRSWQKTLEQALLSGDDPRLALVAVETLAAMGGPDSAALARKALEKEPPDARAKEKLRALLPLLESGGARNPCAR